MTNDGVGQQREAGEAAEAARRARMDLHNAAGDTLAAAFELALTPAIFAFIGWQLDRRFGTGPLLLIVLFALVMGYEFWKFFTRYDARMRAEEQKLRAPRNQRGPRGPIAGGAG